MGRVDGCVTEAGWGVGVPGGVCGDLDLLGYLHGSGLELAETAVDCTMVADSCSVTAALVVLG